MPVAFTTHPTIGCRVLPHRLRNLAMESNDWNDAEQRVERAAEFFEQCRWQQALDELRAATTINPYNPTWLYNLGLTLDQLNRHEEAIEVYRQVIEIDPNDLAAHQRLGADYHHL